MALEEPAARHDDASAADRGRPVVARGAPL